MTFVSGKYELEQKLYLKRLYLLWKIIMLMIFTVNMTELV